MKALVFKMSAFQYFKGSLRKPCLFVSLWGVGGGDKGK